MDSGKIVVLAALVALLALVTRADAVVEQEVRWDLCLKQARVVIGVASHGGAKACVRISTPGVRGQFFSMSARVYDSQKNGHSALNDWKVSQTHQNPYAVVTLKSQMGSCVVSRGVGWSNTCPPTYITRHSSPYKHQKAESFTVWVRACDYESPTRERVSCGPYTDVYGRMWVEFP